MGRALRVMPIRKTLFASVCLDHAVEWFTQPALSTQIYKPLTFPPFPVPQHIPRKVVHTHTQCRALRDMSKL